MTEDNRALYASRFTFDGVSRIHTTAIVGTSLTREWALVRIKRLLESVDARVTEAGDRLEFTWPYGRAGSVMGSVQVRISADGIEVSAQSNLLLKGAVSVGIVLIAWLLFTQDIWASAGLVIVLAVLLLGGTILDVIRTRATLAAITRAGAGLGEAIAA